MRVRVPKTRSTEKGSPSEARSVMYEMVAPSQQEIVNYRLHPILRGTVAISHYIGGHYPTRWTRPRGLAAYMTDSAVSKNSVLSETIDQVIERALRVRGHEDFGGRLCLQ